MRLDRFLWWARLAPTRKVAQAMAEAGTLRLDGRRIDRAHAAVRPGAIIAYARHGKVRVLRVAALPRRRGPPAEAASLYEDLQPGSANPVDAPRARE
ncbi:RNA-binding S4 domain-containing protein [Sphingomonadaceae bacterium LXI357]|uniref:RNA-binding S4 domain-containing protein n=2 Tax=Stakelama marina TaxID=2826939 RepID=A0A8T4IMD2_9SPHN|nr:RNA-binding S4 domain-containing protein [Stakelama marina]